MLPTPGGDGVGHDSNPSSPQQVLDFSNSFITPSPQPLPPDYMKELMSAPKSTIVSEQGGKRNKGLVGSRVEIKGEVDGEWVEGELGGWVNWSVG